MRSIIEYVVPASSNAGCTPDNGPDRMKVGREEVSEDADTPVLHARGQDARADAKRLDRRYLSSFDLGLADA
jgi:hypothetical protein